MTENSDRPFLRWQARTIEQLGYANNLLVALGSGGLAFSANLLLGNRLALGVSAFGLLLSAAAFLLVSVLCGLLCVFSRLSDFRVTARIARGKEKGLSKDELSELRSQADSFGKSTWRWFWREVVSFGLGATSLATAVTVHVFAAAGG